MVNGLLIGFVFQFQSLEIMQQQIDINDESEDQIIIKMDEKIEDTLFSGTCKNTKDWPQTQWKVCDTSATLRSNYISRMTAQLK